VHKVNILYYEIVIENFWEKNLELRGY